MILLLLLLQDRVVVAQDAYQPKAVVAEDGTIYAAMIQNGNIVVVSSPDGGKNWSKPVVAIDNQGKAQGGMQRGPRIGVDRKGNLVVTAPLCFDESEFKKRYPTAELWLVRSSDGGASWTKPVQINEVSKKAPEALHWMAVDPEGNAHVAWLDMRDGKEQCLWYSKVAGEKVGKNLKLTGAVCECCAPGLAVDAQGNPYIVVREGAKKNRGVLLISSKNGGKSFTSAPGTVNTGPTGIDQ